jgi:hypothetical protein
MPKKLFSVRCGYLAIAFGSRSDANRFRRLLCVLRRQGWKVPEGLALRLRDMSQAGAGRSSRHLYNDAIEQGLVVAQVSGPVV